MAIKSSSPMALLALTTLISIALVTWSADADGDRRVYIVYMGERPSKEYSPESVHLNILDQVLESSSARESLVYSYESSFNGLAAKLTPREQQKLSRMEGIVSVFPSRTLKPHTTRSWDFLGLNETAHQNPRLERDVIVGVMDTGIWPESKSFSDKGFGPPPRRWKGVCQKIKCNNKIIGARYYHGLKISSEGEESSPRDFLGHGTHTASTVAGSRVENASLYGLAAGSARGGVPSARIAVYKVCWKDGCQDHDILKAFDDAIADGVDIISISMGAQSAAEYFEDPIAIGSFHAMRKGILTSTSAGNSGPNHGTVANIAPWMLVVGASSTDRRIIDRLVLGNGTIMTGVSVNTFPTEERLYPLFAAKSDFFSFGYCDSLNSTSVEGKIVLCEFMGHPSGPLLPGAKGAVMLSDSLLDVAMVLPLPAIVMSKSDGWGILQYINSTRNPMAKIRKSEAVFDPRAPVAGSFSARGPSMITPDILKPDLSAPGIDILAAYSPQGSMSDYADNRKVSYNIMSGTSMACPHATGAAAYVKSYHPRWSPAAIMSALITTASPMNASREPDAELAYGAGQIDPKKALHPGLVYEANASDYVQMLCNQQYTESKIRLITRDDHVSCPKGANGTARDLNYPSMSFFTEVDKPFQAEFARTVTNVGAANSKYTVKINSGSKLTVTVNPQELVFGRVHEKLKFVVRVSGGPLSMNSISSASIIWSDGKHSVRSPIIVHTEYSVPMGGLF